MRVAYTLDSFGEVNIKGYKWFGDAPAKGIVLISHGMAETIDRYDAFANHLVEAGFVVYGHSHRGHGQTAGSVSNLGILGDNGWMKMKEDLKRALLMAKKEYPELPAFILGHSMGSFLLRDFLMDYSQMLDGAIVSGTGFMPAPLLKVGRLIAGIECKLKGTKHPSKLIDKISFGGNNKRIENPQTPFDWLSRDAKAVEKYIDDPFCGVVHSSGFFYDFFDNLLNILYTGTFVDKKENLPLFIFSGDGDPVGDYGKGVERTKAFYEAQGFKVTFKLYPNGRHEMLNEINRNDVFTDVTNWLVAQL